MEARGVLRGTRAAVFSALCVFLAAFGHVTMSATPVPGWALLAALAATGGGARALAGHRRGPVAVMGAALVTQALLHLLFSLGQAAGARSPSGLPVAGHAHQHPGGHVPLGIPDAGTTASGAAAHPMPGGVGGMIAAHAAAAPLSAVWLWWGERAVFRLLRWAARHVLVPVLRAPSAPASAPEPPAAPRPPTDGAKPRRLLLVRSIGSRGQPGRLAVRATARRHGRVRPA
ncbi:hypothetical protein [Streptomyces litchfieldiae]|uniref:Integral membrane protein n=1 Tax=Streptomyces litchfieldiae TaxID=3075543 RepID=A0ABU2MR07_9ACTN|nr:hypothetical protein [Streptomyces sp. DSM 44938]MDT0343783.1 hypothetical protein [Streptomyces sp. DSM 44938]